MSYSESSLLCVCVLEKKYLKDLISFALGISSPLYSSFSTMKPFLSFKLLCGLRTSSGLGKVEEICCVRLCKLSHICRCMFVGSRLSIETGPVHTQQMGQIQKCEIL